MKRKQKISQNYVDLIFAKNEKFRVEENPQGEITIFIENKGFFNSMAQKLFKKPRFSQVHLEEFGNFIWKQIDGKKTVLEISEAVHEKFGEKAEPLVPRLVQYFYMLESYDFVLRTNSEK